MEEIEAHMLPVNDILAGLPFGAHGDRLHINLRRVESRDITLFRRELKTLASDTTQLGSPHEVEARFARLKRFIDRIRKSDKVSRREYFIDVRRHVEIDAERRDTAGRQLSVYTSIGGKSGGGSRNSWRSSSEPPCATGSATPTCPAPDTPRYSSTKASSVRLRVHRPRRTGLAGARVPADHRRAAGQGNGH